MTMTRRIMFAVVVVALVCCVSEAASTWVYVTDIYTTATYDISSANNVDRESATNTKTLAQFKTDVATAYVADLGGVCTFDNSDGLLGGATAGHGLSTGYSGRGDNYFWDTTDGQIAPTRIIFGATQSKAVTIEPDDDMEIWTSLGSTLGLPTSSPADKWGGGVIDEGACLAPQLDWRVNDTDHFAELFLGGESIIELAVTALAAADARDWTLTVTLDDDDTMTQTFTTAAGVGLDDVFAYFAAPAGRSIVAFKWEVPNSYDNMRPRIDDLAIIITPEPATLALLLISGLAVSRRRG